MRHSPLIALGLLAWLGAAVRLGAADLRGFTQAHCIECHGGEVTKGGLDLTKLKLEPGIQENFARWEMVFDRVAKGEMPPKKSAQPPAEGRATFVKSLGGELHAASLARQRVDGRVLVRRLNVTEYETTLRDLLGRQVAVKDLLPPDETAAGFDKVSAVLELSSVHLLRYQDAAEQALKSVVPRELPAQFKSRLTGREVVAKSRNADTKGSLRVDGDALVIHAIPYNHITLGTATVPQPGRYRVRASLQATGTEGRPLPVRFSAGKDWGRNTGSVLTVRDAPADRPTVIELECELDRRELVDVTGWSLPTQRQFSDGKLAEAKPGPGLAIHWLEIEGPLGAFPPPSYQHVFGDLPLQSRYKGGPLEVVSKNPRADAERLLRSFLPLAFRRPVPAELHDYYLKIVLAALDRKLPFEQAMLLGCRAALCSPHFLLLAEPLGTRQGLPAALDDYAVAARLSYFLWSTLPDAELVGLAAKGELTRPAVLRGQVERLLKDARARRFTENFAGQWLDLHKLNDTTPSPQLYGEFDDYLFWSMPGETTRFFEAVLGGDRPLTDFTHSDWTFLNERLAKHYGIPGVFGGELREVKLPANSHRGGVLTHASILKVTADGTKTSPILRGKWVLERLLGQPPAPPPPNVPAVEPDIRGATTIRQQLDKHRDNESCNACHRHIDPPGFALEAYDVIGGWRDFYRSSVHKREAVVKLANYPGRTVVRGPVVEPGGVTAGGRTFRDLEDYKQILLADKDQLARCLTEKLLVYATGAELQFADREVVEQLVAQSRAQHHGFRSLVHAIVQSRIFLNK